MRFRYLPWIWTAVFLTVVVLSQGVVNAQTQKSRIAYSSRSNTITPFYIAASKGFFREEGLDVELIQVSPRLGALAVMNGDVSFTTSFTSTFRGILQGLPLKLILVALKKGIYFLVVRPEIKDVQDLKGKKLGVATIRGTDQLVAEELLRSKGFNPALLQQIVIGETPLRAQALVAGIVQVVSLSPPHDLVLQQMGYKVLAGPPEVGLPASGLFTSDRLLKENPQALKELEGTSSAAERFMSAAMLTDRNHYWRWIWLAFLVNLALFPAEALHAQIQKIRISTSSRSNTTVTYYVAVSKGFFREEGFDVELIQANPLLGAMA